MWVWGAAGLALLLLCGAIWAGMVFNERQQQERRESALGIWTDRSTGLTWMKKDNGADIDWKGAVDYCESLRVGDYPTKWRVPHPKEIDSLWHKKGFKGGITLSTSAPVLWTGEVVGHDYGPGAIVFFGYNDGGYGNMPFDRRERVLCVNSPVQGLFFPFRR
jgi:hypothetical protein